MVVNELGTLHPGGRKVSKVEEKDIETMKRILKEKGLWLMKYKYEKLKLNKNDSIQVAAVIASILHESWITHENFINRNPCAQQLCLEPIETWIFCHQWRYFVRQTETLTAKLLPCPALLLLRFGWCCFWSCWAYPQPLIHPDVDRKWWGKHFSPAEAREA